MYNVCSYPFPVKFYAIDLFWEKGKGNWFLIEFIWDWFEKYWGWGEDAVDFICIGWGFKAPGIKLVDEIGNWFWDLIIASKSLPIKGGWYIGCLGGICYDYNFLFFWT